VDGNDDALVKASQNVLGLGSWNQPHLW